MQSIENKILINIKSKLRGVLLFAEDFQDFGTGEAIRLALHRLEKKNEITRVAQGIYVRPVISELIGPVLPTAEEVAKAIAKRDRIRIIPAGAYAMNALGLSTQVPLKLVLLTDGSPRVIKIRKCTIKLKKTAPKILQAKGEISSLVIQALKEIGNGKYTVEEEQKIIEMLKKENPQHLVHDLTLAPAWIRIIMRKALL
ncbi:hypothetical protein HXX01_02645 [Candidatus Nomurabacteria bacterium]|nr:hypothetical protein [Candidatus Nomurabacteria bacterium]